MEQPYAFQTKPRAGGHRGYDPQEDGEEIKSSVNIMYDKRVVRGSTYSSHFREKVEAQSFREKENTRRRRLLQRRKELKQAGKGSSNQQCPGQDGMDPIPGHKHSVVQTESYLEELSDKVPEVENTTQTDPLLDRPPEPLFIPAKTGLDVETQVDVEELFDFDLEVEPILEVLVGKTIEHAMLEVMEEQELAAIRAHQADFELERDIELAELQRLEAEAKRRESEKLRRIEQEEAAVEREKQVLQKVAARAFAKEYSEGLNDAVFNELMESGKIYDPVVKQMEEIFMPAAIEIAAQKAKKIECAQAVMDDMLVSVFNRAAALLKEREQAIKDRIEQERQQAEKEAEAAKDAEETEQDNEGQGAESEGAED